MSGFLSKIFGAGVTETVNGIAGVVDRFVQTKDEKAKVMLEIEQVVTQRLSQIEESARSETVATMEIIKAEMAQGDNYTKRARPSVVYFGLFLTFWNYMVLPTVALWAARSYAPVEVPNDFWWVWGGICSAWVLGRTAERIGVKSKVTEVITGNKFRP